MNRLGHAASPYLLQHRDNPVDWWEWCPDAFAAARSSGRPVLLSVGYAACHWCHVMAHESFEDPAIAGLMNELFVNIKVDREERPDIDHVYMSALHSLGEQGGWPLTMFLTAQGEPFWGGTYFPPVARHGRPGFPQVLRQIAAIYAAEPERIGRNAAAIRHALVNARMPADSAAEPDVKALALKLAAAFDTLHGGLRGAPKFPNASLLAFLQLHAAEAGPAAALTRTLDHMARGGLQDQLGGGFARYAVDEAWLVPHFEKMLYDNALLLELYARHAATTGSAESHAAAEGIVAWLKREMLLTEGAFAASLDADSEGEEGRFYVWTPEEIARALPAGEATLLARTYDVNPGGNWEGKSILNRLATPAPKEAERDRLERAKTQLLAERDRRVAPGRDDKIMADWNGLAIAALARASGFLNREDWLALAKGAYRFVVESMADGNGLAHSYREGRRIVPGFALDHAAMTAAALALHDATGEEDYLGDAVRWSEHLERLYRTSAGILGMTRADSTELPVNPAPTHDDAVPNANGLHLQNLVRLAVKGRYDRQDAEAMLLIACAATASSPLAHASVLSALTLAREGIEVLLAGTDRAALRQSALALADIPVLLDEIDDRRELPTQHPAAAMLRLAGSGAAFICRHGACLPPVSDPNRLAQAIREAAAR